LFLRLAGVVFGRGRLRGRRNPTNRVRIAQVAACPLAERS
jgi:hypothetical protein